MNSEQFRQIRKALNLTKVQMAAELGLSEKTIYNYENSGKIPLCVHYALIHIVEKKGGTISYEGVTCKDKGFLLTDIIIKLPVPIRNIDIKAKIV